MLTFIATMMVQAQNEYSTLVIETKAGTTMELSLQKKPRVVHCDNNLMVGEISYAYEEVRKFYFKPYDPTSIEAPIAEDTIRIAMLDQSKVLINGVGGADKVRLYTLDGRYVITESSMNGNVLSVSLDNLTPGTYILNIDDKQSFKLLKR